MQYYIDSVCSHYFSKLRNGIEHGGGQVPQGWRWLCNLWTWIWQYHFHVTNVVTGRPIRLLLSSCLNCNFCCNDMLYFLLSMYIRTWGPLKQLPWEYWLCDTFHQIKLGVNSGARVPSNNTASCFNIHDDCGAAIWGFNCFSRNTRESELLAKGARIFLGDRVT